MAKKKKQNELISAPQEDISLPAKSKLNPLTIAIGFFILAVVVTGGYFAYKYFAQKPKANTKAGLVTGCQKTPAFLAGLNFGNRAALSTAEKARPGLWIIEGDHRYQHPSWKNAGFLAPIEQDKDGNIFVAPAPFINVLENPPDRQNAVWRVDGKTQEMTKFLDLPHDVKLNEQNAYGTLDLAYDCDTENLYVSSVFGSTRDNESGKIYRIDTKTKQVKAILENVDGFGLGVFNTVKGKRLFYGLARRSEVWSIGLDDNGEANGPPRKEVSLENLGPRGDDKVRRITFQQNGELLLFGVEFNFNLIAPTEKQEMVYRFRYNTPKDLWEYVPDPPLVISEKE